MRIDTFMRNYHTKVTSPDGKYIGTDIFLIAKECATPALINGFNSNPNPIKLYEPLQNQLNYMANYMKEHKDTVMIKPSNVKTIEYKNHTYHVAEISTQKYVFIDTLYTKHFFNNGFTFCCPYLAHPNLLGIMKKGQIVGIIAPIDAKSDLIEYTNVRIHPITYKGLPF